MKKFNGHKDKAFDKIKLFGQILDTVKKLVADIGGENEKLKVQYDAMVRLHKELEKELVRYGKSLPLTKGAKEIKKRLAELKKCISEANEKVAQFEKLKQGSLAKERAIRKALRKISADTLELGRKKAAFAKEKDKEKKANLKKEIKELAEGLKKAKKTAKEDLKKLMKAAGKAVIASGKAMRELKEAIKKIRKEQDLSEDEKLLDLFSKLISSYRKGSNRLKKLNFKLGLLKELAKALRGFL